MGELTQEQRQILALAQARARLAAQKQTATPEAAEPRGFMGTLRDNVMGDDDPTTQNFGEKLGSTLNKAGEALTFGLIGDEADAAVAAAIPGGMGYDERLAHNRQQEELLQESNPGVSLGAEIGGGLLGALTPMGLGSKTVGLGRRMLQSGTMGAVGGGTYGFMEGEGLENRTDQAGFGATLGGIVGGAIPVVGAGIQKGMNNRAFNRAVRETAENAPSTEQLRQQGQQFYRQVDDAGVEVAPESFNALRRNIVDALNNKTGFDPLPGPGGNTPRAARVVQTMDEMTQGMNGEASAQLPFSSLDQLRRRAGSPAMSPDPVEARAGSEIIGTLDDYVRNLGPDDVAAGDIQTLQEVLPKARDTWARMSRSQTIDDAIESSENYLSGGASGIRNQFRRILNSDKLSRGFSAAEKRVLQRVVNGSIPEQLLNLASGGVGQLAQIGAGFGVGGLPGAMLGAGTAAISRKGAEALSSRNAEIARAVIANGGMPNMPQASNAVRNITEALTRRITATTPQ